MKNKTIIIFLAFMMSSLAFAAKEKIQEPLRLRSDRDELIAQLNREKIRRISNPTSPEEIAELKNDTLATEVALGKSPHDPVVSFRTINLKSNNYSSVRDIYLSPNFATTLIFLDKRGNYWPIESYVLPLPEEVISRSVINTGVFILTPKKYAAKCNLIVMLKGAKMPLMLTLNVGVDRVDYKTELRVDDYGPNSKITTYNTHFGASRDFNSLSSMGRYEKKDMFSLLDGITPNGYKKRGSSHDSVEFWSKGKVLVIKTKANLIAPSLIIDKSGYNPIKASDGSYLYMTPLTSKVLLSMAGNIISVSVK